MRAETRSEHARSKWLHGLNVRCTCRLVESTYWIHHIVSYLCNADVVLNYSAVNYCYKVVPIQIL
jgi:hypothetical protein